MKTLDEQIADIEKLDELRRRARELKQEAIEALTAASYVPRPRPGAPDFKKAEEDWRKSRPDDWDWPDDEVEKAQVLHALRIAKAKRGANPDRQENSRKALIADLCKMTYKDLVGVRDTTAPPSPADPKHTDDIPILRTAYMLQALAEIPGQALSGTALACFCQIVQELNEIVDPTWAAGAARADEKSLATAFITGECARALQKLETALRDTATAAELLGKAATRETEQASRTDVWVTQDRIFQQHSLKVALAALSHPIIEIKRNADDALVDRPADLLTKIEAALANIPNAKTVMGAVRRPRTTTNARMRKIASDTFADAAVSIARDALDYLRGTVVATGTSAGAGATAADDEARGKGIAKRLRDGAQVIRDLLSPMEQFAESAIDRQVAAASQYLSVQVDGAELVFAAVLLGLLTDWKRPKVRAAYEVVYPLLSANGRLLSIRPFDVGRNGYRLNVATLEVTRRLAFLVAQLDVEPEPDFVARLMLPFEYTRVPGDPAKSGWTTDPPAREPKSSWWLTAIAVDALDATIDMLDKTINRRVLRQFQVRKPETLSLKLDNLFYPDYGLAQSDNRNSVAIELLKLRAHAGNGPAEKNPLFSLILYGPPGTGKTTLVEAIAASAGVPLVEITPSDILVGGAEGMERRARQVFQALSKLTHVVILFDEFDSILLDRAMQDDKMPRTVMEFLTPGMLPKLKALHDASKTGRMSYVLATNYLDRIDGAVTREGRFDQKCGIFPPDVVSRLGRLRDQLGVFLKKRREDYSKDRKALEAQLSARPLDPTRKSEIEKALEELQQKITDHERMGTDAEVRKRIMNAVKDTQGGPMSRLGQPGWFTAPDNEQKAKGKALGFVLDVTKPFDPVEPEADYDREEANYNAKLAGKDRSKVGQQYWDQWAKIRKWDNDLEPPTGVAAEWDELVKLADKHVKP